MNIFTTKEGLPMFGKTSSNIEDIITIRRIEDIVTGGNGPWRNISQNCRHNSETGKKKILALQLVEKGHISDKLKAPFLLIFTVTHIMFYGNC